MLDDLDGIDLQGLGLDDKEGESGEDSDGDGGELEWARRRAQMSQLDRDYEDGLDELAEEQVRNWMGGGGVNEWVRPSAGEGGRHLC